MTFLGALPNYRYPFLYDVVLLSFLVLRRSFQLFLQFTRLQKNTPDLLLYVGGRRDKGEQERT